MVVLTTTEVTRKTGLSREQIKHALLTEALDPPPEKNGTGHYVWTPADIERLAALFEDVRPAT